MWGTCPSRAALRVRFGAALVPVGADGLLLAGGVDGTHAVDSDEVALYSRAADKWHRNFMTG